MATALDQLRDAAAGMLASPCLTQRYLFRAKGVTGGGNLDDEVADVVFDALALVVGECAPAMLDHVLKNLRRMLAFPPFCTMQCQVAPTCSAKYLDCWLEDFSRMASTLVHASGCCCSCRRTVSAAARCAAYTVGYDVKATMLSNNHASM